MRRITSKIRPKKGFSQTLHWVLVAVLPVLAYVFAVWSFIQLAYALVLLSKWRMFAVRPRHWPAIVRANAIDLIAGLSFVTFLYQAPTLTWQAVWALLYGVWLIGIKPRSSVFWIAVQAGIGQLMGLVAVYMLWGDAPLPLLVLATGGVCYLAARHFLSSFDEPLSSLLSHIWAYFGAALTWVLGHWLLYYGFLSQPALFLSIIGYSLAALYYLESTDRLSVFIRREIIMVMALVLFVIIILSDWGDRAV